MHLSRIAIFFQLLIFSSEIYGKYTSNIGAILTPTRHFTTENDTVSVLTNVSIKQTFYSVPVSFTDFKSPGYLDLGPQLAVNSKS